MRRDIVPGRWVWDWGGVSRGGRFTDGVRTNGGGLDTGVTLGEQDSGAVLDCGLLTWLRRAGRINLHGRRSVTATLYVAVASGVLVLHFV